MDWRLRTRISKGLTGDAVMFRPPAMLMVSWPSFCPARTSWDTWAVLEELDQHEEKTNVPFTLETAAIAHFGALIAKRRTVH